MYYFDKINKFKSIILIEDELLTRNQVQIIVHKLQSSFLHKWLGFEFENIFQYYIEYKGYKHYKDMSYPFKIDMDLIFKISQNIMEKKFNPIPKFDYTNNIKLMDRTISNKIDFCNLFNSLLNNQPHLNLTINFNITKDNEDVLVINSTNIGSFFDLLKITHNIITVGKGSKFTIDLSDIEKSDYIKTILSRI